MRRRSRDRSVRSRIVWSATTVTALAMAVMVTVVLLVATRLNTERIDSSLKDGIEATTAAITRGPDGRLRVSEAGEDEVRDRVWVFQPDGTLVDGPDAGSRAQVVAESLAHASHTTRLERFDRVYIAVPIRLGRERRAAGVAVASASAQTYESSRDLLAGGLAVLGLLMIGLSAALTSVTVARTLRPVARMTDLAAQWSEQDLDSRFGRPGGRRDELTQLGDTLDALLDRVAATIRNEQQLTSELAHELRTPLTSIRGEAELGLIGAEEEGLRERLTRIVDQVDRLNATIGALLALARRQSRTAHRIDLAEVVARLAAVHGSIGPSLEIEDVGGGLLVTADAALVERAIGPVLENAVRYATHAVRIRLLRNGSEVCVRISDDGPGVPAGRSEDIFGAGVRDPGSEGAGLGLALARRVAASLGGSVALVSVSDPTTVEIRLPAA